MKRIISWTMVIALLLAACTSQAVFAYDDVELTSVRWTYNVGSTGKTRFAYYQKVNGINQIAEYFYEETNDGATTYRYETTPASARDLCSITVSSSDTRVLVVDNNEKKLIPVGNGESQLTITATTPQGVTQSHTITVVINDSPYTPISAVAIGYDSDQTSSGVSYNSTDNELSIPLNQHIKLKANLAPSTASIDSAETVTWTTSDTRVAPVTNDGLVEGVHNGTATITLFIQDHGQVFTKNVQVKVGTGVANNVATFQDKAHPGETVSVTLSIQNNPGIVAALFRIIYDPQVLSLLSVDRKGIFQTGSYQAGGDITAIPYSVLWMDSLTTQNHMENGAVLTLTFDVLENAPEGESIISVECDESSTMDIDLNPVMLSIPDSSVSVTNRLPGDANGDGEVNLKDAVVIQRHLVGGWNAVIDLSNADVNGSGTVTLADAVLITRFLAGGWNVVLR